MYTYVFMTIYLLQKCFKNAAFSSAISKVSKANIFQNNCVHLKKVIYTYNGIRMSK